MPMAPHALNVFDFVDFKMFLKDYQAQRQALDKSFTRSRFCRELGLPNTRSFFNDVVKGARPLSSVNVERFIAALGMNEAEGCYFRVLVGFNQSVIPGERELLFDQLVSLNNAPVRVVSPEEY